MAALYDSLCSRLANECNIKKILNLTKNYIGQNKYFYRYLSSNAQDKGATGWNSIGDKLYSVDSWTNVTPKILSYMDRQLHNQKYHPLQLIKQRIVNYMYSHYPGPRGPLFSVYDQVI